MQEILHFKLSAKDAKLKTFKKKYLQSRYLIDRIRQALGKVIKDLNKDNNLGYLVGRDEELKNIQQAESIIKWFIKFKSKEISDQIDGSLSVLIENELKDSLTLVKSIILQAANKQNIDLKFLSHETLILDYEITDESLHYTIDLYVPRVSKSNNQEINHVTQWKENYPFGSNPDEQEKLSQTVGAAIKRHLIKNAEHHNLDPAGIVESLFLVRAYWITKPQGVDKEGFGIEAINVTFSAPLKLSGIWTAGSLRHKGNGDVREATKSELNRLSLMGGAFIL